MITLKGVVVSAASHLTTLTDSEGLSGSTDINGNGYTVYYDQSLSGNSWLGGASYSLSGGGALIPE